MADDNELIAAIYDAIIDPSRWDEVVKRVVEATKSVSGGLFVQAADAAHLSAMYNVDPFWASAFVEHWHEHNPLRAYVASTAPGELVTHTSISRIDVFKASAFYNEFVRPQGWGDSIGVGLLRGPNSSGCLALHRSPEAFWIETKEWHLLETLAPHLKRAAEIHQLLSRARAATDSLGAAVAAAGFAVFLLTGDCRAVFANAKAEDLVRRGIGLRYERGRLAAASQALTQRLHALVREAARADQAENGTGGTLELPSGENRSPLLAHVFPLAANRMVSILDIDRPAVTIFVADPAAEHGAQIRRFGARFGLTAAETRVAGEIIGGKGLLAAATKLNISEATARTHAKRIYEKTGVHRQPELIRRFFETAFPGSPSELPKT